MATVSRSTKVSGGTTLQSSTLARATDVETDMLTLFNAHNNHDAGTSKWTVVSALNSSACPLIADNGAGTNDIVQFKNNGTTVWNVANGGNLVSNSKKITGLAAATTAGDALRYEQVFTSGTVTLLGSVGFSPTTAGIVGTTTNDSVAAGGVGQVVTASVLRSAPVAITSTVAITITSISLTAGDWDVRVIGGFLSGGATTATEIRLGISLTNNAVAGGDVADVPTANEVTIIQSSSSTLVAASNVSTIIIPDTRVSLAATTTVYMTALATFGASTLSGFGNITARRLR